MIRQPVVTFASGELSPQIDARSDIDKYRAGCRTLQNMIPRIYGTAERRPGTKYINTLTSQGRVIPFIYSNAISYITCWQNGLAHFYYDGAQVESLGSAVSVVSPYAVNDLNELQYKQSNDVMWLVHGDYAQRKLTRTSATAFSLDEITFTKGPFLKRNDLENDDGVTMTPSTRTGTGTLTASSSP